MAPWTTTPGSETRHAGAPPSTNGTPSTAYVNRARELAERVQASLESNVRHDALYAALASSPATETFAASRAKELMDELIAAGGDGGWRPAEATPARGGDRPRGDDASVGGDEPPRSPHPGGRDDDDDDPATPTPPAGSTTPTGARTPSPTPPTPVDPIEALLSKAAARGADLPVVVVASSDENVHEDDSRARGRRRDEKNDDGEQTPTPPRPSARWSRAIRVTHRESNPRPKGSPPDAFTPLPHAFTTRFADLTRRAADAQSRFDSERRRNDRLARKLTRAESRARRLEDDLARLEHERRTMRVRYVQLGERFDAMLDDAKDAKDDAARREEAHEATRRALERRVNDLEALKASTSAATSAEVARLRSELDAVQRRERDHVDRASTSAATSAATSAEDRARIRELGDRCATLERELRDAAVASVRAQAKERELEATRERLEAKLSAANDALSSERERFDAERTQRPLAPAPTPGLVLFDADADVATPTDASTSNPGTSNLLARIVRTEVADAVESFAVDVAARSETNERLRDAEGKLEVALEAARAAELAAARAGDADALIASLREQLEQLREQLERADERSERAAAEGAERETKSAEAHERFVASLRRDWEARVGELRSDLANARAQCDRKIADAEKEAARAIAEVRLESTRSVTQAEARAQIAETNAAAATSRAEAAANRARDLEAEFERRAKDLEAGFERRVEHIERERRVALAERDRECVRKDAEVSNLNARLQDARAHGDRLERQCLDQAAALKAAEAKASRRDELERAQTELVDAKAELGKTAAIIAEVRANLNASIEREKGAERRAAEAQKDAREARAEFDALRADHERETNTIVAGREREILEKDAVVKSLRDKAEDASARASAFEGRLGAVNEELERVRRELDRRAGDIKRHEAEIERRRDDVIRAENETRRANESLLVARADEAKTAARLEAVERERDAALAASKAAREDASAGVERAEKEARDWRAKFEESTNASASKAQETASALVKAERATLERDGARERLKLKETELDAECARRRELEAVLRHVRDDAKNELVAMRIQLNETKENAKAELARGWDAMRAELDDAREQMARHANEQADAKAAAVLVDLDAQLASAKEEVKALTADLALARAECDAKDVAKRADEIRSDARKELEMEEVRREASTAGKLEGHAGLRREIEALERERDAAIADASTARSEAKASRDELDSIRAKHSEAIEITNDFKLRLRKAQERVRELEEKEGVTGVTAVTAVTAVTGVTDHATSPPRSAYEDIQSMRERPTFIDRDDDDDDDAVPSVTSVEQAVEIIRTDRVALRRAEERASKAEYAAAAATARANEANGAVERLKRGEDESPTPNPNPNPKPFVPPVKPIGDNKKMMSRLFHRLEHSGSPTPSEKDEALAEELERKKRLGEWTPAEDDWRCESEELNAMTSAALRRRCVELELTAHEALEAAHDAEMRAELATQRALRAERKLVEAAQIAERSRDCARATKAAADACFVELRNTVTLADPIGRLEVDSIRARFEDEVRAVEARLLENFEG